VKAPIPHLGLLVLSVLGTSPAAAATWTIGANFGVSYLHETDTPYNTGITTIAVPSGSGVATGGVQAGVRVGTILDGHEHEFYLDGGVISFAGNSTSPIGTMATINYQFNGASPGRTTYPYLAVGGGLLYQAEDVTSVYYYPYPLFYSSRVSGTNALLGVGLGLKHVMHHGHGDLRGELRFDHVAEGSGNLRLPSSTSFGLKLGFDLWMR